MAVRDDRSDVKQTTAGFRDPRHHICQKQIPIPHPQPSKQAFRPYLACERSAISEMVLVLTDC